MPMTRLEELRRRVELDPASPAFAMLAEEYCKAGQFDEAIGLTQGLANALEDPRHPSWTQHGFGEMLRSRVFGILAGYFRSERP